MAVQEAWMSLYKLCNGNERLLYNICLAAWPLALFALTSGTFMVVDLTGKPAWMYNYKVQPDKNVPIDRKRLRHAIRVALFNLTVVALPVGALNYPLSQWMGCSYRPEDFPSLWRIIRDLAGCAIVEEIGFYYSHRLAHWGPLYKAIHKKHHEWTAPVAIVAVYAHPAEHILCNILPFTLGPIFMSAHLFTATLWYTIAMFATIVHHSGYHLPLLPSPEFHDFHHLKFNANYGVLGLLDWFHGTDKVFRKSMQFKRHKTLFSATPISETYPDDKK